jgi:hypothetical protein
MLQEKDNENLLQILKLCLFSKFNLYVTECFFSEDASLKKIIDMLWLAQDYRGRRSGIYLRPRVGTQWSGMLCIRDGNTRERIVHEQTLRDTSSWHLQSE